MSELNIGMDGFAAQVCHQTDCIEQPYVLTQNVSWLNLTLYRKQQKKSRLDQRSFNSVVLNLPYSATL